DAASRSATCARPNKATRHPPVVRFQYSLPVSTATFANVGIKRPPANIFFSGVLYLTLAYELAAGRARMSNPLHEIGLNLPATAIKKGRRSISGTANPFHREQNNAQRSRHSFRDPRGLRTVAFAVGRLQRVLRPLRRHRAFARDHGHDVGALLRRR